MKPTKIDLNPCQAQVMAIVNVTPDSFYADSRSLGVMDIERRVIEAVAEGASILDIGGASSRPGAEEVTADEELRRVALGVEVARRLAPGVAVSIDTYRSDVAERIIRDFGAVIINDISSGELDAEMFGVVSQYDVPYIAMHMRGTPQTMQRLSDYGDVTGEVVAYFEARTRSMLDAGIRREQIILDPGFGFAKNTDQNFELLRGLPRLAALGYPLLAGVSRKSMIWRTLDVTPAESLIGSVALGWECLRQGVSILRVHDVHEAYDIVRLFNTYHHV